MRVNALLSSQYASAGSQVTGAQDTGGPSFQTRLANTGGGSPSTSGLDPTGAEILAHATQEIRAMLRLQYELSKSTYSKVSNVMKARHETAKNAIGNIR
jgi:hypothetical protein